VTEVPSPWIEAVTEVAQAAGAVALRHFNSTIDVEHKHDGSPVTIADRSAEQCAREWIRNRFPNDSISGEEYGEEYRVKHSHSTRRWIIDPIDGTKSFIRGVPLWGTLVAVCNGSEVIAGAAYFPALGETLAAAIGGGAWWNGVRCHVSDVTHMKDATVLTTDHRFPEAPERRRGWERIASGASIARDWGDCYGYLLVATGRAEVMLDGVVAEWDVAALFPAIIEAGGVFTDCAGHATPFGNGAVATNKALAREARALLEVPFAPDAAS
jgi:histidinol-phosphatase